MYCWLSAQTTLDVTRFPALILSAHQTSFQVLCQNIQSTDIVCIIKHHFTCITINNLMNQDTYVLLVMNFEDLCI